MQKLVSLFSSKGRARYNSKDEVEKKEDQWARSETAGSTSQTTVLVNKTEKTLVLRDKVGPAYGATRYTIPGKNEIKVTTLQHTFFKMLAYVIQEEEQGKEEGQGEGSGKKKKKKSIDTRLTIDSDQLADCRRIEISTVGTKYKLHTVSR